jgi:hypothetical protein
MLIDSFPSLVKRKSVCACWRKTGLKLGGSKLVLGRLKPAHIYVGAGRMCRK